MPKVTEISSGQGQNYNPDLSVVLRRQVEAVE